MKPLYCICVMLDCTVGTCLNARDIYLWCMVQNCLRNMLNDLGLMALALLANDRFQAIINPMAYHNSAKHPGRWLAAAFATVGVANGADLLGETLWVHWGFTWTTLQHFILASQLFRAIYAFACFYT